MLTPIYPDPENGMWTVELDLDHQQTVESLAIGVLPRQGLITRYNSFWRPLAPTHITGYNAL
jgi:hypothetical protein